jgi:N-carbamoyl-L-amino-acid hydrolase
MAGGIDGIAGVAAALEVARALAGPAASNFGTTWRSSTSSRRRCRSSASRASAAAAMAGVRPAEWLSIAKVDGLSAAGRAFVEAGGDPAGIAAEKRARISRPSSNCTSSRGRCWRTGHLDIGVVTAIAGITRIEIVVQRPGRPCRDDADGQSRQDALAGAALAGDSASEALAEARAADGPSALRRDGGRILDRAGGGECRAGARAVAGRCAGRGPGGDAWISPGRSKRWWLNRSVRETGTEHRDPALRISDNLPTPGDPLRARYVLDAACRDRAGPAIAAWRRAPGTTRRGWRG